MRDMRGGDVNSMVYTGRNSQEVRAFIDNGIEWIDSWFVTKGQTASTGGQAWRYIRDGQKWPEDVAAAVFSIATETWLPVRRGDSIMRADDGDLSVKRP